MWYFKNGEYFVQTQRKFQTHLNIPRHGIVDRNTILKWVTAFSAASTVLMTKLTDKTGLIKHPKTFQTFHPFFNSERYIEILI